MLRFLRIEHLAVIDALEVEFEPGLNVLTGETGAGKSMLVEAVGLLLGGRASADLVRTGEAQASVEAMFEMPASPARQARELIVRREVTAQGRSRAFVDGALVSAAALRDAAAPLVELHGQHEHQVLFDRESHLDMLDAFAALDDERVRAAATFAEWRQRRAALDAVEIDERERTAQIEVLGYQLAELDRAAPRAGEDEELELSRRVLGSAERLKRLSSEAYSALYESDASALALLSATWKRVADLGEVDPAFRPYLDARDTIKPQLEDLAYALREFAGRIDASPTHLQEVEDRLALLERLKRKYGPTLPEVVASREALLQRLDALRHADERRAELVRQTAEAREAFLTSARALSRARRRAAAVLCSGLCEGLSELAMPRARFEVRFDDELAEAAWTERGIDAGEFYLSANVGEDLRPLARIASGGELSRVMLAMRTLTAAMSPGKTLVFDEVDAGIGGRVADVVGRKLAALGQHHQVLCITHLPQIAARGGTHFAIEKATAGGRTLTSVVRLAEASRIDELARMIGGSSPTPAARAAAGELLHPGAGETIAKGESERAKAKARK